MKIAGNFEDSISLWGNEARIEKINRTAPLFGSSAMPCCVARSLLAIHESRLLQNRIDEKDTRCLEVFRSREAKLIDVSG